MTSTEQLDGRAARWADHNAQRRRELVEATLKAIRRVGPTIGMDELAAELGTSKAVLYRHFGDRTGLYRAVVESVSAFITTNIDSALAESRRASPAELIRALADAYLSVVERDPEIYAFVAARPTGDAPVDDPITGITGRIGDAVAAAVREWLVEHGLDAEPANTWGHGAVGFVWAVADRWITTGKRRPRAEIVAFVERLFEPAFHQQTAPGSTA